MMQVWKLPAGVNIEAVNSLTGTEGSRLNAIEDANGNFILSQEEYNCAEFQQLKFDYADIYAQMELIDYAPKIVSNLLNP